MYYTEKAWMAHWIIKSTINVKKDIRKKERRHIQGLVKGSDEIAGEAIRAKEK